jgi:hypothetical protein
MPRKVATSFDRQLVCGLNVYVDATLNIVIAPAPGRREVVVDNVEELKGVLDDARHFRDTVQRNVTAAIVSLSEPAPVAEESPDRFGNVDCPDCRPHDDTDCTCTTCSGTGYVRPEEI